MTEKTRREFLGTFAKVAGAAAASGIFPPAIEKALAVPANHATGTIRDVEHIVILTQENRSFDHYFGTMPGVRGFADPFPIPVPRGFGIEGKTIWHQPLKVPTAQRPAFAPFHLNTMQNFEYTRIEGTPHAWTDAQHAWDHGRMHRWAVSKNNHSLGYYAKDDLPFQWALAQAFTICDAYHCASQTGTNPNRLFLWTGTNDLAARGGGPGMYNDYDWFEADPGGHGGYSWVTYAERLEAAGISWQVYEDMDDNFTDNPLAGFKSFRDAWFERPGFSQSLRDRGASTRDLDALAADVRNGTLPQVSWIVATAEGSEHPGPSSPAQGADYTARVLEALTANPEVWSKTVLFLNFDENDGFFDHVPPPAPPSYAHWDENPERRIFAGGTTVDAADEYHENLLSYHSGPEEELLRHRPLGLGPRVPMYVISPWSKGGWVNSQVFDHTSVLRFIEARFGVMEPNISSWRRAVCGDLTSAFDFTRGDDLEVTWPDPRAWAIRARALEERTTPPVPEETMLPVQESGVRPSRALPYELHAEMTERGGAHGGTSISFRNTGTAAAVFHVYDRLQLDAIPRRFTVEAGKSLRGTWSGESYDLWVVGPGGFHRHFRGVAGGVEEVRVGYGEHRTSLRITLSNEESSQPTTFVLCPNRYTNIDPIVYSVPARQTLLVEWPLVDTPWYDFTVKTPESVDFGRRFAGRVETGRHSTSDPAMAGAAIGEQYQFNGA